MWQINPKLNAILDFLYKSKPPKNLTIPSNFKYISEQSPQVVKEYKIIHYSAIKFILFVIEWKNHQTCKEIVKYNPQYGEKAIIKTEWIIID